MGVTVLVFELLHPERKLKVFLTGKIIAMVASHILKKKTMIGHLFKIIIIAAGD